MKYRLRALASAGTFLLMVFLCAISGIAQNAHLSGLVKDPSSAVVSGAHIELLNIKTGVVVSSHSNEQGYYSISSVQPGEYQLSGTAPGFEKTVVSNIVVHAADSIAVDIQLRVGKDAQEIKVSDKTPLLQTETASISTVVTQQEISNIPLEGQNPLTLIGLAAGITKTSPPGLQTADRGTTSSISYFLSNGSMDNQNEFTIDGIANNITDRAAYMPFSDDVQEFNVLSAAYDAQYGHGAGASIVVSTKAGTNEFHGSAYEFLQNDALEANNYFSDLAGQPKPPLRYNQFGVAVGGPIRKKSMFFFLNYDGIRTDTFTTTIGTVPTAAQRTGDFSSTYDQNGQLIQIYNPFTSRPDPLNPGKYIRDPFPNNMIPASMLNATSAAFIADYPLPNQPGVETTGANNYEKAVYTNTPMNNYSGRLDYQLNEHNRLFGKYARESTPQTVGSFILSANGEYVRQVSTGIGWSSVLNSSTTLESRIGWMGYIADATVPTQSLEPFKFSNSFLSQLTTQFIPAVSVAGMSGFGQSAPTIDHEDTWSLSSGIRHVVGRHDLKAGFEAQFKHSNNGSIANNMSFSFDQGMTQGPDPTTVAANIGDGIASFLLGTMTGTAGGSVASPKSAATLAPYYAVYGQDTFRASPRLSLNIGLRWEVWQPGTERYNRLNAGFAYDTPNPIQGAAKVAYAQNPIAALPSSDFKAPGGLLFATPSNRRWGNTFFNNFGPRVGFDYRINDQTVVRGGFGTFYNMFWAGFASQSGFASTTSVISSLDGITPYNLFDNPIPDGLITPTGSSQGLSTLVGSTVSFYDRNSRPSGNSRWSLGVQRQLTPDIALEVDYVGETGIHIPVGGSGNGYTAPGENENSLSLDYLPPQYLSLGSQLLSTVPNPFHGLIASGSESKATISEAQLLMTYPEFTGVTATRPTSGRSYYNSLQATATKRMSHGLSLLSTYTFSKLIDRYRYLNPSDPAPSRMISEYDAPQRFTVGGSYELPFGRGRQFGWQNGIASQLVSGWRFGLNEVFQSGFPITLSSGVVQTGVSPTLDSGKRSAADWFNKAAFTAMPAFTLRAAPWTISSLRADGIYNWDVNLMKDWSAMRERIHVRFQADAFNLANRTQLSTPNVSPTSSGYGTITSQANSPRNLQVGLKVSY